MLALAPTCNSAQVVFRIAAGFCTLILLAAEKALLRNVIARVEM